MRRKGCDSKFTNSFDAVFEAEDAEVIRVGPSAPNLNAYAERWIRGVKEEVLSRLILFGEGALRHTLAEYVAHYHHERNHQGKDNLLLCPALSQDPECKGAMECRERLGGLLKYYTREAA